MQIKKLKRYCEKMLLDFTIEGDIFAIEDKVYKIITDNSRILFDNEMNLLLGEDERETVDGYVFEFIGRWYLHDTIDMKDLKYIGKAVSKIPTNSFLGIRSGYELLNGMGLYPQWIDKAKFLGIKSLGTCEKHTLSGVLDFQVLCADNGIKPITGMTIVVDDFEFKLYAKNFQGWQTLLRFNEELNVNGALKISESFFLSNIKDVFVIIDPKYSKFDSISYPMMMAIDYYQLDTVRFLSEEVDIEYIDNLEKYLTSEIEPISITDAFYLEQDDWKTREKMWATAKAFDYKTNNQYFKSKTEYATELIQMFEKEDKSWQKLFKKATKNESYLIDNCNFVYDRNTRHLPKYIMTEEEKSKYSSNNKLFIDLLKKGLVEREIPKHKINEYLERIKLEVEVLKKGDVIDYFLSLYDIINFAKSQGMLTGIGRGSAGGSLVAYLLGIIHIDPLEFDLLFERFLNSGRMGLWKDRPAFIFEDEEGNEITLPEGTLVRVNRDNYEMVVFVDQIVEGDEIIKY